MLNDSSSDEKPLHEKLITKAESIIRTAAKQNVTLRLIGGLAIRNHCEIIYFCDRPYGDIDFVGLKNERNQIRAVFFELGYQEDRAVIQETYGARMLFYKGTPENHIDIFLDFFEMDHKIDLRKRLELEEYTIAVSDLLLTKLQIFKINEKDIRDIITMVKDLPLGDQDVTGQINIQYIAKLCSKNWGLYQDVINNIEKCIYLIKYYKLSHDEQEKATEALQQIRTRILNAPKSLKWKFRALLGKRIAWHHTVEGAPVTTIDIRDQLLEND
ncbi:MAG: hypothetical protein ACFE9D_10120 [Promethearchaeota archaeon]